MNTCLICGRGYSAPPAISQTDNKSISICDSQEAVEAFLGANDHVNYFARESADAVVKGIEQAELEAGKVEALP